MEIPPDPDFQEKLEGRYLDSRVSEKSILFVIDDFLESIVRRWTKRAKWYERHLVDTLGTKFEFWQFGLQGLNSGGNGEAFTRLVATGILKEIPYATPVNWKMVTPGEVDGLNRITWGGLKPNKFDTETGFVVDVVVEDNEFYVAHFQFNTSVKKVRERKIQVDTEMEKMRKQMDERENRHT